MGKSELSCSYEDLTWPNPRQPRQLLSTQADTLHCLLAFAKEAAASKKDNVVFLFVGRSLCEQHFVRQRSSNTLTFKILGMKDLRSWKTRSPASLTRLQQYPRIFARVRKPLVLTALFRLDSLAALG